jgi:L-fuculose-phosphate aldolase
LFVHEFELRKELCEAGRRLYERGLAVAYEGNLSARLKVDTQRSKASFLITPAGAWKGDLRPEDLLKVTDRGEVLSGRGKPTSELPLHLGVYRTRPATVAVVHAHPPVATGFACSGKDLPLMVPEVLQLFGGGIPCAPYARPGSQELFDHLRSLLAAHSTLLMERHGVLASSEKGVMDCFHRMEQVEQIARIALNAHLTGTRSELSEVQRLQVLTGGK